MRSEDEHSFDADDPVAQYWLHNCVGFRVRGLRGGTGVVHEIGIGADGVAVLAVRRRGVLRGTALVPAARVDLVDPWDETIVLHSRRPEARQRRSEQTDRARRAAASAGRAVALGAAVATSKFFGLVARLLLALAALIRRHSPGARRHAGRAATSLAVVGQAYAREARRAYREQRTAMGAWRAERRRPAWGDDSELTRARRDAGAGADDADARREDRSVS